MFFGQKCVFFPQSIKIVIFCRMFSRVFVSCVCLCTIFSRFFLSIFIFVKFRITYRVHMHPRVKTPPSKYMNIQIYSQYLFLDPGIVVIWNKRENNNIAISVMYGIEHQNYHLAFQNRMDKIHQLPSS